LWSLSIDRWRGFCIDWQAEEFIFYVKRRGHISKDSWKGSKGIISVAYIQSAKWIKALFIIICCKDDIRAIDVADGATVTGILPWIRPENGLKGFKLEETNWEKVKIVGVIF